KAPVSVWNPLSSTKSDFIPPPRSSSPRRPQREPATPPVFIRTTLCPCPELYRFVGNGTVPTRLTYSTLVSTTPYNVTLDCADAGTAPSASTADMTVRTLTFFVSQCSSCTALTAQAGRARAS